MIRSNDYRKNATQFAEISQKLKTYAQANKIPVISESWIDLCYEYSFPFSCQHFACNSPTAIMLYPRFELLETAINAALQENLPKVLEQLQKAPSLIP